MRSETDLRILLIGKGGREHALAWKLSQFPMVEHVFVVPGNAGTASGLAKVSNHTEIAANDSPDLVLLAKKLCIGLVVAGPDDVVIDGMKGYFRKSYRCHFTTILMFQLKSYFRWNFLLCSYERGRGA